MESLHLEDRTIIALSGPEARGFLQGLITNDIEKLVAGVGIYAALLTPQGKVISDFFIAEGDGSLLLDCDAAAAEGLLKKLKLYRLRAKLEIEIRTQLGVYAGLTTLPGRAAVRAVTYADPRLAGLGPRSIGAVAEMPDFLAGSAVYHAARLSLGVPEAKDFGSDKIFALDAGLDELHAIAFDKGCYVGQELTARMKHRGTARKRLLLVSADGNLPPPGSEIRDGETVLGEIVSVYGAKGFALVRLDRLDGAGGALDAAGTPVTLEKPSWLQ
jgi:tRNA-modifying protein YgfZ